MFLDESGTHENSPCLILAGFAVHEHDAYHLQRALTGVLDKGLKPLGLDSKNYELHANEIRNPDARKHKYSPWRGVDPAVRLRILGDAYRVLSNFHPHNERLPLAAFGVVVDKTQISAAIQREELAYELILNKFDAMLSRLYRQTGERQRGIVVHDERVVAERDIQAWTDTWRQAAGRIGRLTNFAEVPLFADSRASRLLQAADLVAYAVWRYYGVDTCDERLIKNLWPVFDCVGNEMHGIIHMTPQFARGQCGCPPCVNRFANGAGRKFGSKKFAATLVTSEDVEQLKEYFSSR